MHIDPQTLDPTAVYKLLISSVVPRPIAWVSSLDRAGVANLAPFSYFMAITGDPRNTDPACALSPYHGEMVRLAREEAAKPAPAFVYRNPRNAAEAAKAERPLVPAE